MISDKAVIDPKAKIAKNVTIGHFSVIGDNNTFRECVTVSRGTVQGGGKTVIGNDNLFMAYVHIAHDCVVGSQTIFSNNASLAGHVTVNDFAILGGLVGVHQFCNIGSYSFCGGGSIVVKDVAPFVTVSGYPAETHGLNLEGLKRRGLDAEVITSLKRAYKIIFRQGLTIEQAIQKIRETEEPTTEWVELLINFVKNSERGIIR